MSETLSETTEVKGASSHLEVKTDHLTVRAEIYPGCLAMLHITITPEASQAVYAKAVKIVSKEVSLPGFRKGKAPVEKILKHYSNAIKNQWNRDLVNTSANEAIELIGKKPYADDSIKDIKIIKASLEENSEISFTLEYAPEVPVIKLGDIVVKRVKPEMVDQEAIEEEFKQLQFQKATWQPIEGREAREGDYVDVLVVSGEDSSNPLSESARFLLQEGKMPSWMYKAIIGLNVGETVEADVEKNKDQADTASFEPFKCKVTLEAIYQAILPEVDAEFAKKFGVSSVEEFRHKVETALDKMNQNKALNEMERQVIEQLLANYPFEIPEREHKAEEAIQYQRLESRFKVANVSAAEKVRLFQQVEHYISTLPNNYRLFYIARNFAKIFNIKITEQELSTEITKHLLLSRSSYDTLVDETMDPRLIRMIVYNHLLLSKVILFILKNAQIIE